MQEEINNCIEVLKRGGLIFYPTDTSWAIGCDATNKIAIENALQLAKKGKQDVTYLVAHQAMLERHLEKVPDVAYDIIDLATKPTTLILDKPKGVAKNFILPDNTIAIRVASDKFCQYLINKLGKPIIAIPIENANGISKQKITSISNQILQGVDYVVNLQKEITSLSSIIKLTNSGVVKVIRE